MDAQVARQERPWSALGMLRRSMVRAQRSIRGREPEEARR